jgi:Protein of unknown function (DUF732)
MIKAVVVSAVLAAGGCAPVVQADTDQYDQYMISHGAVQGTGHCADSNPNCGETLGWLRQQGQNTCNALAAGKSPGWLTDQLEAITSIATAQNIVYAAQHYLCPGASG